MALSEDDIDRLADEIVHGAEERYVAELTASLADRMAAGLSAASTEQLLQLARECQAEARRLLAEHGPRIEDEVRRLVERALEESDAADSAALAAAYGQAAPTAAAAGFSAHFAEIAGQTAKGVAEIIARQNVAMAESAARLWYEVAGEAVTAVNHGLKPRADVLAEAVAKLAGIDRIEYASGVRNRIDVAVRRHVVTQASQAGGRMTLERMRAYGHDLVVTSAHYGARPSHAAWQGLPARIGGPGTVGGKRYPGLVELTGYGTVGGLKGANCRHSINPYFPGATELPAREWPEHEKRFGMTSAEYYEATQRQRELERRIRDAKREIACIERAGVGFESPAYVQKRLLLGRRQAAIRKHCADKGLVRLYEREKAYGVASQPRALRSAERAKAARSARYIYGSSQAEIDDLLSKELSGIRFVSLPSYNGRIKTPGLTKVGRDDQGRKYAGPTYIGKQAKPGKAELIDTIVHEELEARIWLNRHGSERYWHLNSASDDERHAYIQKIIDRYVRMKGIS